VAEVAPLFPDRASATLDCEAVEELSTAMERLQVHGSDSGTHARTFATFQEEVRAEMRAKALRGWNPLGVRMWLAELHGEADGIASDIGHPVDGIRYFLLSCIIAVEGEEEEEEESYHCPFNDPPIEEFAYKEYDDEYEL
jgi:hypothetical protein